MNEPASMLQIAAKLSLALALVAFNGFFVAAEFALVKIRDTQLEAHIRRRHRRAGMVRHILANLDGYLSACQLGITLASLALGWVAEPVFAALLEPVFGWFRIESAQVRHFLSASVGIMVVTFFHVVVGEQAPKFIAIKRPLPSSLWVGYPLHWFYLVTYPLIWVLNRTSLWVLERLGIDSAGHGEEHSEDELRLMLGSTLAAGGSSVLAREIVQNSLDLGRRRVREVMRPRREIVALDQRRPIADCLRVADETRYSRFPLSEDGDLDRLVGVVHVKDIYLRRDAAGPASGLRSTCKPVIYVPETARLDRLLQLFLDRRLHLAVVVDEYGSTTGMVTLENVLEELVGQIQDEFDQEKARIEPLAEGQWRLDGALPLFELAELVREPVE
ncbi:MAG: hemolysin family protein, partial [Verrucomicrobium sp.]|nr:hemolysin family protein [Verrucomicrobium sp.]